MFAAFIDDFINFQRVTKPPKLCPISTIRVVVLPRDGIVLISTKHGFSEIIDVGAAAFAFVQSKLPNTDQHTGSNTVDIAHICHFHSALLEIFLIYIDIY